MKVLALTRYGRLGASSRMRIHQYIPGLKKDGIDVDVSPLLGDAYLERLYSRNATNWIAVGCSYLKRMFRLFAANEYDFLWVEKELFPFLPAWFEKLLCRAGIRYIVDYDDAIFHKYDLSRNPIKKLMSGKIDEVMHSSALVICGNNYLASRALSDGSRRVEIIPTVIDLERYAVTYSPKRTPFVIGWIGSMTSAQYLEVAAPSLQALSKEYPVILRIVGVQFSITGVDVECRAWREESEVCEIQDFDIGMMPLVDGPWERGKCGYKLIQYMACGKPVVASSVGVNREIVEPGVNGYLARNSDDWLQAFRALCENTELRRRMGEDGRRLVEQKYCLQVTANRLARMFHEVAAMKLT